MLFSFSLSIFLKISLPDTFQIKLQITKIMGSYTNLHVHVPAHMQQ